MATWTISKKLNVSPYAAPLVIQVKQYTSDFALKLQLYSTVGDLDIPAGATTKIRGTKRDGNGYELTGTRIGHTCTFSGTKEQMQQMTAVHGRCVFEVVVEHDGKELITANFYLEVQRAAMDAGTVTSESIIEEFADFQSKITAAQAAATAAQEQADRAEAAAASVDFGLDATPTQGSANAVSSGGVYDKISSTSFFEQKMSVAMAEIIPNVVPILEMGDMTIDSSGWTYNDGTARAKQRVRTAKGYSIPLKRGDKVGLTDYTDAKYYLGWRLPDESYGSHGWYTADTTIAYDGDYVILLAHATEVDQTGVEDLGNLLFIKKFGGYYNPVAVSQRSSGKDILKTTTWVVGYIDARGDVHAPTTQQEIATDFIAIDTSTVYRMRLKHLRYTESTENNPWLGIASYDADRHFVRRPAISNAVYKDDEYEYLEMLFTPQSGEASVRVSFRSFGDYSAELIALTDGISWYGYPIQEPRDFQGGHNLYLKGVNHRGWGEYPENTLEAYVQSAIHGFNYVETDVRYTSDGVPVLLHDASINRTAKNADGTAISSTVNIGDITYAQSQEYDFGIYKGSAFAGIKIPKFEDFIVLCKRLGLHPYIELKTGMSNAQIINLVDIVLNYGMENDVTWIAYPTGWFTLISNKHKKSRFGVLMTSTSQTNIDSALSYRTGENSVFINTSDYGSTAVALAKTNGIPMEAWTLDEDADILALDPYITGVTSNLKIAGAVVYSNLTT